LQDPEMTLIAHNLKYDLTVLETCGLETAVCPR
jgi:hypothetical protein